MRASAIVLVGTLFAALTAAAPAGTTNSPSTVVNVTATADQKFSPGVFFVYQTTHDSYPAAGATAPANGRGYTLNIYEPVFKDKVLIGFRREMTDDGLGTISHYGNIDLTIQIAKYLRLYTEASLNGANPGNGVDRIGTPAWRAYIWWTMPVAKPKR